MVSQILEEGLATNVGDAWDQPALACIEILEMRAYQRMKSALKGADKKREDELQSLPAYEWVQLIDLQRLRERSGNGEDADGRPDSGTHQGDG